MRTFGRVWGQMMMFFLTVVGLQAQTITSFSPSSAKPGTTVTITGTGFSLTMANDIVYFGAGRGTVTGAGATSLSVTVPPSATYGPISVSVLGSGKSAISHAFFDPAFSAGDFNDSALTLSQTLSLGGSLSDTRLVDLDGDGKLDLLVTRSYSDPNAARTIAFLQNTSSGGTISFAPKVELPSPQVPRKNYFGTTDNRYTDPKKIITADLDGDGKQDFIIVTSYDVCIVRDIGTPGNPNFQLWQEFLNPDETGGSWEMVKGTIHNFLLGAIFSLGGGAGAGRTKAMGGTLPFNGGIGSMPSGFPDNHYVWVPDYLTNMFANDATVADFNGDGRPDIAVAYSGTPANAYFPGVNGRLRVFLNTGSSFNLASDLEIIDPQSLTPLDIYSVAAADFRGNDTLDLVVGGSFDAYTHVGMVTVLANGLGDGTSFVPIRNWIVYSRVERVVTADFDGDAKPDVAYQSEDDNEIRVRRNTSAPGDLSFSDPLEIPLQNGYKSVQVSDIDGDGKPDLFWACEGASGFKAARNTSSPGSLSFAPPVHYLTSLEFQKGISVGDLDGDGKPDVISLEYLTGGLNILKNSIPPCSLSQSQVSVTTPVIAKSGTTPVSLQIKDASGNNLGTTGLTVTFGLTGSGTSAGSFGATGDVGGGVYTAIFNGTNVGTAKTVSATINGNAVTSTVPTVRVAAGSNSVAQSTVLLSRPVVASGATATVEFQAKDANGDTLTTGGLAGVTFFLTGSGTSSGTFGTVTDSSNGKYYATFTATTAGTAKNISARISTDTVKTSLPTVTVNAGHYSLSGSNSSLTISTNPILKYDTATVTLQVKDSSNNTITTGGLNVKIQIFNSVNPINNGKAYLTDVVDNQNGTYTSKLIGLTVSTGTAITASISSSTGTYQSVNYFPPTVSVVARPVSLTQSALVTDAVGRKATLGSDFYVYLYTRDDKGEVFDTPSNLGGLIALLSDGSSGLLQTESSQVLGGGVYRTKWHANGVGTTRHFTVTINGDTIKSALPGVMVVPTGAGITYPGWSQQAVPLDTVFTWLASTGATDYRIQIVADSLNGSVLVDSAGITTTSYHSIGLQNFRKYYFRQIPRFQGIEGLTWDYRDFTTVVSSPLQIFPQDRQEGVALPVSFGWGFVQGADSYRLQVALDTGFVSLVANALLTDSTTVDTLTGLTARTKYFWRINAMGGGGTSGYSTTRSFATTSADSGQPIYYVKTSGNDASAGTSWGTAFATLQHALTMAGAGSQVWVAAGTYKPTSTTDRSISFLLKNGVAVYGGFAGTETNLAQRNWQINVTILSGDIDGDATLANNSYHVVTGNNTYATSILDGFTISGGNADGGQHGGGIYCSSGYPVLSNLIISNNSTGDLGGGMYNVLGNPTLTNVTFTGNASGNRGGGLYTERGAPSLINCTFTGNNAIDGAGVSNGNGTYPGTSNALFTNVIFKNNTASHFGGGMYSEYGNPVFNDVLFYQNSAGSGGGIYHTEGSSSLANVTFSKNSASSSLPSGGGGGIFDWLSSLTLKNVILWGNSGSPLYNGEVFNGMSSTVTLYNTLIQDGIAAHGGFGLLDFNGGVDADSGGNVYVDPLFVNAGTGDVRLSAGSPAIDSGNNAAITTVTDLGGNPRIVGARVDIGAYEYQSATSSYSSAISRSDSLSQFGTTKVELEFTGIAPGRSVLVFSNQYATSPDSVTFAGPAPAHFSPFHWVIAKTGDAFASAVLSLDNVSSYPGVVDPATLAIYHRTADGIGGFSPLTTTYDPNTDRLTATITSFSEFIIGSDNNPLAVQITSFTGIGNRLNSELRWVTATETNSYGFEIERTYLGPLLAAPQKSKLAASSMHWDSVGFMRGSGVSSTPKHYIFMDRGLAAGRYSYRLKSIDSKGGVAYSSTADVDVGLAPKVFSLLQNYPNPFNPTTAIEFTIPQDGRTTLRVYDLLGREVETLLDQPLKAGEYHQTVFNASRLASGVYFSVLRFNGKQLLKKMLLLK